MSGVAGKIYEGIYGDDSLKGSYGDDTISGNGGNDFIHAGAGDDVLIIGAGDSTIYGGSGNDTVRLYGSGEFLYEGGAGNDIVFTFSSPFTNSTFNGGAGDDFLNLRGSHSLGHGGSGNDALNIWGEDNTLHGGSGDDNVFSYNDAGNQTNFLFGDTGADTVVAAGYEVVAHGGSGNDVMIGRGDVTLIGGTGKDRFSTDTVISNADQHIVIEDFTINQDKLWILADNFGKVKLSMADLVITDSAEGTYVSHDYIADAALNTSSVEFFLQDVHGITAHDIHFMNSHGE